MSVKLLTEHHLEFLSLKEGCTGLSEYTCKIATLLEINVVAHFSYDLLPSQYLKSEELSGRVLYS